jgi:DNA-binding GntR family transcriptional regulator
VLASIRRNPARRTAIATQEITATPELFRTKTDTVCDALTEAITTQRLKPGEWIRNSDWANRLGVSAIPVREALRRLEAQGLVEIDAHRGARVTSQTDAHIEETYLIRIALETLAARLALETATPAELQDLIRDVEALTADLERNLAAGDSPAAIRSNHAIHMAVYRASKRPRLVAMIENLWATYPFGTNALSAERAATMVERHRRYLEVLRTGDPERMAQETELHISEARTERLSAKALLASV